MDGRTDGWDGPAHGGGHEPGEAEERIDKGQRRDHQHVLCVLKDCIICVNGGGWDVSCSYMQMDRQKETPHLRFLATHQVEAVSLLEAVRGGVDEADRDVLVHEEEHRGHERRHEGGPARLVVVVVGLMLGDLSRLCI